MSNFTIEELKSILSENGVEVPSGRLKKEDYLKLYSENISLNASLGETYASDDESSQNSRRVTSTNGSNNSQNIDIEVEEMSNDDLFNALKQLNFNPGPILENTRKVYEKKLIMLLSGETSVKTNGHGSNVKVDISELSDNEVDIPVRNENLQVGTSKREISREPSVAKARGSREPSLLKTNIPSSSRESSVHKLTTVREGSVPKRVSYIETIPRGSSQRIIENVGISDVRQRHVVDAGGDRYVGRWSPRISTGVTSMHREADPEKSKKNIILFILAVIILLIIGGFTYSQWIVTDPYQQIEKGAADASRKSG